MFDTIFFSLFVLYHVLSGSSQDLKFLPHSGYAPRFVTQPRSTISFDTGTRSVLIECQAIGRPAPEIRWKVTRNPRGEPDYIPLNDDPRFIMKAGMLEVKHPKPTDMGLYQCEASNAQGASLSDTCFLEYKEIEDFKQDGPKLVQAVHNAELRMKCDRPGVEEGLHYRWYKNSTSNLLQPSPRIFASHSGDLYFSSVTMEDRDTYYCGVMNPQLPSGQEIISQPIIVSVTDSGLPDNAAPSILTGFPRTAVRIKRQNQMTLVFECFANGSGILNYEWARLGIPLQERRVDDFGRILTTTVNPNHVADYRCKVTSQYGQSQADVSVSIDEIKEDPHFPISMQNQPQQRFLPGANTTFHCNLTGTGRGVNVKYKWYHNAKPLTQSEETPGGQQRQFTISGPILTIYNVSNLDDGVYQCRAFTMITKWMYSSVQLSVESPVKAGGPGHDPVTTLWTLYLVYGVFIYICTGTNH